MMKKLAVFLALLLVLLCGPALAENGQAEFSFEGTVYHVAYAGAEIVDGKLNVAVSGFGPTLPLRNGSFVIIAWAAVVVDGAEIGAESVNVGSSGVYTYIYDTASLPDQVLIYPYEDDENAIPLWQADGAAAPEPGDSGAALPEFLTREWQSGDIEYEAVDKGGAFTITGNFSNSAGLAFAGDGGFASDFSLTSLSEMGILPFDAADLDFTQYDRFSWDGRALALLPDGPELACDYDEAEQTLSLTYAAVVTVKERSAGVPGSPVLAGGECDLTLTIKLLPADAAPAEAQEAEETGIPEELVGAWKGVGTPENGGTPIDLTLQINADGTGEYTFDQGSYHESYPFTITNDDSSFSVDIPATSQLGSVAGGWRLEGEKLLLDITTTFASGGSYAYHAECERAE